MAKVNKVRVSLSNVRLSFAQLFEAKSFNDSKPAYSANFLIDYTDTQQVEAIKSAIAGLIKTEWTTNPPVLKADKIAFKDGNDVTYEGYKDKFFVSAKNYLKPALKDLDLSDLTEGDAKLISGDYVNVVIEFWAQDNSYGKRINCNLVGVQFIKKGERFGGGTSGDMFKKQDEHQEEIDNLFGKIEPEKQEPKLRFGGSSK